MISLMKLKHQNLTQMLPVGSDKMWWIVIMFVFSCFLFAAVAFVFSQIMLLLRDDTGCENMLFDDMELGDNYVSIEELFQSEDETVV